MKRSKDNWFMFVIDVMFAVVPTFALAGALVLYIGAKDSESRRQQEHAVVTDTILPRNDYRTVQPRLETLEDSIHEFEDGF